ncbi:extensin family protein [Erythrobacteraceae bacterium CFH 75059]|uniref:extensin family protein n=1 Tax=Qipengyuania thermophila TaxID=2509361 RepID=UPI001021C19E|nr:extensin family protein [Qipengyuania thermophila]TCD06362.1 extensin family protein [Erythrobacteraceae bacterium CFH 75059]
MRPAFLLLYLLAMSLLLAACARDRAAVPTRPGEERPRSESRAVAQCVAQLHEGRARFSTVPDQTFGNGCAIRDAVFFTALGSDEGSIALGNIGPVACPLAQTFAAWARYGVDRAARQILGSPVVRIETMGSYACRNVAGTARLSAHSQARAIDIAGFVLADGRRISVLRHWTEGSEAERQFLRTVHASACRRFGTVLGPDYNAAHRDHFHLEESDGRFCR